MKKLLVASIAISLIIFTACKSGNNKSAESKDMNKMGKDTTRQAAATDDKDLKVVAVTYTQLDAKAVAAIKEIIGQYLRVKNALADDNGNEAASSGKAMEQAIRRFDKSLLTAEQKKIYDEIGEDLQEHAEHIGKNGDNIKHQREHFSMMSEDVYDLAKAFGGGQTLYHDHCPMYNEGKGAMWLSEMKEIKNPYFGAEMPKCGKVEEVIK